MLESFQTVREIRNQIGESPIASHDRLYWVDAETQEVFSYHLIDKRLQRVFIPLPVTAIAFASDGGFVLATRQGIYLSDAQFERFQFVCDPASQFPDIRINDAVVCPNGHLWFGTMNEANLEQPDGKLYLLPAGLKDVIEFDEGFAVANGIAFSVDGKRLYLANMFASTVLEYQLDDTGCGYLSKRPFVVFDTHEGLPDGLTVDAEGNLYVGHWAGQSLSVYGSDGVLVDRMPFPAYHVTRATFYGPDLTSLAVTSGCYAMTDRQTAEWPGSGHLFLLSGQRQGRADLPYQLKDNAS